MIYLLATILLLLPVLLLVFALFAFIAILIGAPYVPTSAGRVKQMIALAKIKPAELVVDLGSGDGRILIAAAAAGARAVGIEINPVLALITKLKARLLGFSDQVRVIVGDFRDFSVRDADTIFCYHLPGKMLELEKKIRKEAKPGARIVLNAFPFPKLKPLKAAEKLFVYVV